MVTSAVEARRGEFHRRDELVTRAAGAAAFVKQLGARPFDSTGAWSRLGQYPTHGPDIAEWDADFAVREFPEVAAAPA